MEGHNSRGACLGVRKGMRIPPSDRTAHFAAIVAEFNLIQQKRSKLSRAKREEILREIAELEAAGVVNVRKK